MRNTLDFPCKFAFCIPHIGLNTMIMGDLVGPCEFLDIWNGVKHFASMRKDPSHRIVQYHSDRAFNDR